LNLCSAFANPHKIVWQCHLAPLIRFFIGH
jgi:hypothetical protein